ncbi:MAG TPA: hypothetical protein VMT44_08260 [Methanoregula sp.]|nr:hypothetical protein [Methanoregula sp.]
MVPAVSSCSYDQWTGTCTGTCVAGGACQKVSGSSCGGSGGCGCVALTDRLSIASAGTAQTRSMVSHYTYPSLPSSSDTGVIASVTGFFTGIIATVEHKQDLKTADPRAYTAASSRVMIRPPDFCLNASPTVLDLIDTKGAFVNMNSGSRKEWFAWSSADPAVRSGIWQVSIFPFPVSRSNWSEVPGMLATGNLDGNGGQFAIDFSQSVPTAGDVAAKWADRRPYLSMESGILARYKEVLNAGTGTGASGPVTIGQPGIQQRIERADTAIASLSTKLSRTGPYTAGTPGSQQIGGISSAVFSNSVGHEVYGPASIPPAGTLTVRQDGVKIPSPGSPVIGKDQLAGTLPQLQRTFYVRVVPFDWAGNYTGNPSNEQEVIVGEPMTGISGPWSGWSALPPVDMSGFSAPPEMVYFNDRLYLFGTRSNQVFMNSVDSSGAVSGWTVVPGSVKTGESPSVTVYPGGNPAAFSNQHLYIFASNTDTQTIWYTRMDRNGNADASWQEVPHQNVPYQQHFTSPVASADYDQLFLLLDGGAYSLVMTGSSNNDYWSAKPNAEVWNWGSGLSFSYIKNPGEDVPDNLVGYAKFNSAYAGHAGYFILSSDPVGLSHANDPMSSHSIRQIGDPVYIPSDIVDGVPGFADVAAARYADRQYFFVRGKQGHIYTAWMPLLPVLFGQGYGQLQDWQEVSPGSAVTATGLSAVTTSDNGELALIASGVSARGQPATPGMSALSTGDSNSTHVFSSDYGSRTINPSDVQHTAYSEQNVNISWTRTDPFWFAWSTDRHDLISAAWQVSTTPFDESRPVLDAPGIVAGGPLDINTSGADYGDNSAGDFKDAFPSYISHAHVFPISFSTFATAPDTANPSITRYYLRVVTIAPTGTPGRYEATASVPMAIDWSPPSQVPIYSCTPPVYTKYVYTLPRVKIVGYTPIHPAVPEAYCYGKVTTGIEYYEAQGYSSPIASAMAGGHHNGDPIYICKSPDDTHWYDDIVEFFSLIWNFFEEIVDGASQVWNTVKGALVAQICFNDPGCETAASAGLDVALAAEGIPPTIPDFDGLAHDGIGYIAATVSDETGIPFSDTVAEKGLGALYDDMKSIPNPNDPYGVQPDPAYQYQPARLEIELSNDDPVSATPPGSFTFSDDDGLFTTAEPDTPFPSIPPATTIRFPLVLKEDQWKGVTCTESLGGGMPAENLPCDQVYPGQINTAWWDQYTGASGDNFVLRYAGMSKNTTAGILEQMSSETGIDFQYTGYDVFGNYYNKAPDCMAQKYGLDISARSSDGTPIGSSDILTSAEVNPFHDAWTS